MLKVEATYYCELHGMFTISLIRKDAPQYMDCPHCSDGSKGILASAIYTQQPDDAFDDARNRLVGGEKSRDYQLTVETIRKMAQMLGASSTLDFSGLTKERKPKVNPKDSLADHEAQEREKMLQAIAEA